ncbi:MAG TPA: hypothetical protein DCY12_10470 [Candidatus Atribacteria bacterium]|nr:hypothetical protein [Candidatus Atribacteria bacterium]
MILKTRNFLLFIIFCFSLILIFTGCLNKPAEPTSSPSPTAPLNPKITSISPDSGPSGTKITLFGLDFGAVQGSSQLVFKRGDNKTFEAEIITWSDLNIYARVPQLMKDTYKVYVIVNEVLSNQVEYELKPVGSGTTCTQCG